MMASSLFRALLRISLIAKGPIFRFFCWAEKRRSEAFKRREDAQTSNTAALEETLVSKLVTWKALAVKTEVSDLLAPGAINDHLR